MHRDAEAEGAERGGSLRRHHLRRVVRRPHLQDVLREGRACQEQGQEAEAEPDRGRRGRHDGRHRAESAQDKRLSVRALELRTARAQQRADVDRIPRRCRFSLIPSTLGDRSNPPPDSDDSDDDLEYDIYGWFNFETDAEGVQRLDRKWVPLAAAAAAEDFSDALDAYEEKLEAKKKDFQ